MKRRSHFFLPVCLLVTLMGIVGFSSMLHPETLVHQDRTGERVQTTTRHQANTLIAKASGIVAGKRSTLLSYQTHSQAENAHQIDAAQCYADPQLQTISTQSVAAGSGRMVLSLNACPGQQALFGQF